jgi:hypothetical protein
VAQLQFVVGGQGGVCSGALLNDRNSTGTPYLLTANHCIETASAAASLEAFWDFTTNGCNGFSNIAASPRSLGSTLLATSRLSDFTLVRLGAVPGGRTFLGWNAGPLASGTRLVRISHPAPSGVGVLPQMYSETVVQWVPGSCGGTSEGRPLDDPNRFIKSIKTFGGTFGGSSGAPVILPNGQVVGQLFGVCGGLVQEGCSTLNHSVDGAFAATYPLISAWLEANDADTSPCISGFSTLCLNGGRFEVEMDWQTAAGSGVGNREVLTPDTGYFWFFKNTNVESVVKILNGCGVNNHYWVFAGGLTNVATAIRVRDTKTGAVKTYSTSVGTPFPPIQDTQAFATCP